MLTYPKLTESRILIKKKKHHLLIGFEDSLLDFYLTPPKFSHLLTTCLT